MAPNRKFYLTMWSDQRFICLSDKAKLVYMYAVLSPHSNRLGLYYLPKEYIVADLNLPPDCVERAFQEVLRSGLIRYDQQTSVILVPEYIFWDPLENPKQVKGAVKALDAVPVSPELFVELKRSLESLGKQMLQPLIRCLEERIRGSEALKNTA